MNTGDRVNAGQFGLGTLVRLSKNDALVRLDGSGLQVEVPLDDLSMENGKQPKTPMDNGPQASIGTRRAAAKDAETTFHKRLAIEASMIRAIIVRPSRWSRSGGPHPPG